jgi:cytidylate kinase
MLHVLDPHSNFFDPKSYSLLREEQRGKYYGVGMQVGPRNNKVIVIAPFAGTPAYRAGIHPGDVIIAVDGLAASGKGTIARAIAVRYGLPHLDTGLLYRAVALNLWRWGGDPGNEFETLRACDDLGLDPDDPELRSQPVSEIASRISVYPEVRAALLERQQDFAGQEGGAVLDGRDIGTVIAPGADVKLFVTASPEVRARRRLKELEARGMPAHFEEVLADIRAGGKFSECHFIEFMACPGGCLGGGGQPIPTSPEIREKRARAIYSEDNRSEVRKSHENPAVLELYTKFLTDGPCGHLSHKLLHTHYVARGKYIS